jgi:hypothetical protein
VMGTVIQVPVYDEENSTFCSSNTQLFLADYLKGQPGTRSTRLCRIQGRVRPLWMLCTQFFPAFLQDAVFRT